jgi:hypothetical protein
MIPSLAVLAACSPDPSDPGGSPTGDPPFQSTPTTDTAGEPPDDTGTPVTTPTTPLDCTVEPLGVPLDFLPIPSSEDFTIGADGLLYGVQTGSGALTRTSREGVEEMLVPNVSSWGRGTRFLVDGDLVVAEPDTGSLIRFDTSTWGKTLLHGGLSQPNGIAIGDDGYVHLTQANGIVLRIEPVTGESTVLHDTPISTDGITFSPDYRTLSWNSENGEIIQVVLDEYGAVTEGPSVITTVDGGTLDGMTADACGNLYVIVMSGLVVLIKPDGTQRVLVDLSEANGGDFISAANFGSGVGGFERDHLYVMSLSYGVFEIDIGIDGKWEPHFP